MQKKLYGDITNDCLEINVKQNVVYADFSAKCLGTREFTTRNGIIDPLDDDFWMDKILLLDYSFYNADGELFNLSEEDEARARMQIEDYIYDNEEIIKWSEE